MSNGTDRQRIDAALVGTNTGDFLGNPATGRRVDVGALAWLTVAGGRVVELRAEFDELGLLQQIGVLPQPVTQ